jgi:adenosylcobinamide-GDP ribazoletransferase
MNPVAALRGAVAFLTRIPVGDQPISPRDLTWAPACFPLVGVGLGFLGWGVLRLAQPVGSFAAATFATAFVVLVTGAFHEDGLADSVDGLLGAVTRERALEIMKDSRIGSYGAAALILILLMRVGLVSQTDPGNWLPLVLSQSLGRLGPVWLLTHVNHAAPNQSKNKDFFAIGRSRAWWATTMLLLPCVGFAWLMPEQRVRIGMAWLLAFFVTAYIGRLGQRRLGGITGDLLGASEQLGEVAILASFAAEL